MQNVIPVAAMVLALALGVGPGGILQGQVTSHESFAKRVVTTGLADPFQMVWGPDDYLWVTERTAGRVTRVRPSDGSKTTAITIGGDLQADGPGGVLGMALDPGLLKGTGNDFVYVAYTFDADPSATAVSRRTRIVRFTYNRTAQTLGDSKEILTNLPAGTDHQGGRLVFGPDRRLYFSIGDLGANQLANFCNPDRSQALPTAAQVRARDWSLYEGKVLRLNLDGSIPADNPTIAGVKSHIYSYGHRNPQGLVFMPDGKLYESEHGPNTDDEVNLIRAGRNYGWPHVAGYIDDQSYAYANWSASKGVPCQSLKFTAYPEVAPSVPMQKETAWRHRDFTPPIQTFHTVPTGYDFKNPKCADRQLYYQCWPTVAPSSLAAYTVKNGIPGWNHSLLMPSLKHGTVFRLQLDAGGTAVVGDPDAHEHFKTVNRYRDVVVSPDGLAIFIATDPRGNTQDESGRPAAKVENPGSILEFRYVPEPKSTIVAQAVPQKGDWPMYGRDPAGTRYSPLDQINTKNVTQLQRAWVYHTKEPGRAFETTPIVVDNMLYFSTQNQTIVALEPETGKEIWRFDPKSNPREHRGVSYWPGDQQTPPRILFGTGDGRLMALDAKTGTLVTSFGDRGAVDLKAGITDKFPRAPYAITSPPAIYRDVVIVGPATQEGPTFGPSGDPRAYDVRTGKLVWRFHTVPQPGEPGHDTWGPDGWKDRSGPSAWGPATIDTERGMVFLPIGNPADSFYGADRKGTNLYSNSVVALDALTGKLRWYYQVVHHDIWDYDLAAPPALVNVRRDGNMIPAVAQITKMGLLFILDRLTGRPVFGVEERPMPKADTPGEASWPTQPFPLKPPPLARNSMTRADLTRRTPDATRFCAEWFDRLRHQGPYTPFGTTPSLLFPGTMGGGNWGGVSFDPTLGYIFVNTSSLGGTGRMVPAKPDEGRMPWRNEAGYTRFIDEDGFPCQQPPWGELIAVNASGDIAWRVPLGSYDAIEAQGIKNAGAANMGGSIVTAGGLVFIGATTDSKFRAFDSRTGKELWVTKLDATADAVPITYQGRNGKQYVVVAAGGTNRFRMLAKTADETADTLIAFALATP